MIVRTYRARRQADALQQAYDDARAENLTVVGSSWEPGKHGCLKMIFWGPLFIRLIPPAEGELTVSFQSVDH